MTLTMADGGTVTVSRCEQAGMRLTINVPTDRPLIDVANTFADEKRTVRMSLTRNGHAAGIYFGYTRLSDARSGDTDYQITLEKGM